MGPHKPEYVPLKISTKLFLNAALKANDYSNIGLLEACLHERKQTNYDELINQPSYNYRTDPKYSASLPEFDPKTGLKTLRYLHQEYFRSDYKG